jgi:hypothetical protein
MLATIERADHRLEVLVPIAGVDGQVVLMGLVPNQRARPLSAHPQSVSHQDMRELPGACAELSMGQPSVAEDNGQAIRDPLGDGLADRRQVVVTRLDVC